MSISINSAFDGGNVRVVAIEGDRVDLEIVADRMSDFYQWFYFRAAGVAGRKWHFRILNAGGAAYPQGWSGYRARLSRDLAHWQMTDTTYDDGVLQFAVDAGADDLLWFAYFAPYSMQRHDRLIGRMAVLPQVRHRELGQTIDGRALDLLTIGTGRKPVWLIARQHPGETMAEWWMEGALDWLVSDDPAAERLLAAATVFVVPNMNPDGSFRGHLRTNAVGANLNREWAAPSLDRSPEVFHVRRAMDETGVAFCIDVHGDEAIPANFLAGFEGIPDWDEARYQRFIAYRAGLVAATPDFQSTLGYPQSAPGQANLTMATNLIAHRYGAVAMTLEMPFKDHDPHPDAVEGWSPARSAALARACLTLLSQQIESY